MKWWPLTGIKNYFTEKKKYKSDKSINNILKENVFKKSFHIFVIDVGNSNLLNFTVKALKAPQYNMHRFGLFFTETPRHADLLLILGPLNEKMKEPLNETINQMPAQFGVLIINEDYSVDNKTNDVEIPNLIAVIKKNITPEELLALLIKISRGDE